MPAKIDPNLLDPKYFPVRVKHAFLGYLVLYELRSNPINLYKITTLLRQKYDLSVNLSTMHYVLKKFLSMGFLERHTDNEDYHHFKSKIYYVTIEGRMAQKRMRASVIQFLKQVVYEPKR